MADHWYYSKGDEPIGPIPPKELRRLAGIGVIRPDDQVWNEEMDDWVPARKVKGLFPSQASHSRTSRKVKPKSQPSKPPPIPPIGDPSEPIFEDEPILSSGGHSEFKGRKKSNTKLIVIGVAAGGFMLMMILCCGVLGLVDSGGSMSSSTAIVEAKPDQVIRINSFQLLYDYEENDIAADKKYKGKILEVSGPIKNISRDIFDNIYVTLKTGQYKILSIQCYFADDFEDEAAKLRPYNFLTIRGRCYGKSGNVILKNCIIVR